MSNSLLAYSSTYPGGLTALMSVYINCDSSLLFKSIDSIYKNTLVPDIVLVVLDGPISVATQETLNHFSHNFNNFITLPLSSNVGLASALNFGISNVRTRWVARCDQDDINSPLRFERLLTVLLGNSQNNIIGSNIIEIDNFGNNLSERRVPKTHIDILRRLPYRSPFNHMSVIYEADVVRKFGGYPNISYQDYGLWIKLLGNGCRAENLQENLVYATTGTGFYSRRSGLKIALDEFKLHFLMYRYGFRGIFGASFWAFLRSIAALLPTSFKKALYQIFLRHRNSL